MALPFELFETTRVAPIAVVICTYTEDRLNDTLAAIHSCATQDPLPEEIIVVVDHNPRLARHLIKTVEGIRVVENEEARGLSGARNTGVRIAKSPIVAFLDDDACARPGWIGSIADAYEDPEVMAFGGAAHPRWPRTQPDWFPSEYGWVIGCSFIGQPTTRCSVRNLMGCNMSFLRSVFEVTGGFASEVGRIGRRPAGCEETELCIRLSRSIPNSRIIFDPELGVDHRVSRDRTTWRYFLSRCWSEGLSKAVVSRLAGHADGLSTERSYVSRVLPKGFLRHLGRAVRHVAPKEAARSGAIALGLLITTLGYLFGSARRIELFRAPIPDAHHVKSDGEGPASFAPTKIVLADLAGPMCDISSARSGSAPYQVARVVGLANGRPIGCIDVPLDRAVVPAEEIRERLIESFGELHIFPQSTHEQVELPAITVVVPTTWSRPVLLERCLRTLADQDYQKYEVLVVDNRPEIDRSAYPAWPVLADERFRVISEPKPGASAARNAGVEAAFAEIVAFTDDDVEVDRRWLHAIGTSFVGQPEVGCVTGLVLPGELETPAQILFEQYGGFGKGFHRRTFPAAGESSPLFPYSAGMFGSGNNVAFRRSVLRSIGGYDVNLGPGTAAHSGEDLALFVTLISKGHSLTYEPAAVIHHFHRLSFEELEQQVHHYGVGLTAMLTSLVLHNPRHLFGLIRRIPRGVLFLLRSDSERNERRSSSYPKELVRAELTGMFRGPFAYLWAASKLRVIVDRR